MVVSGASSSARNHAVDRFYKSPAIRRQQQQQQQLKEQQLLQQEQQQQQLKEQKVTKPKPKPEAVQQPVDEGRVESDGESAASAVSSSAGNLDRFLESTTPMVSAQYPSKRGWRNSSMTGFSAYFELGNLWESYREWSAYGAGVPLVLNGSDSVIQYYVPYLSGIQLYVDSSRVAVRSRRPGEESDGETFQDTSSESSSSSGVSRAGPEVSFGHDAEACQQSNRPVFEYFERDSPYGREPLTDKIAALANKFPGLKTYKSCDLLPSSWISVAWYPIYRIPTGHTLRDLDACFLTFHSLSTSTSSNSNGNSHELSGGANNILRVSSPSQMSAKLSLPVFGLASYKLRGSIWTSNGIHEQQLASSLLQAADNWLRLLHVDHPDFSFFISRYNSSWR